MAQCSHLTKSWFELRVTAHVILKWRLISELNALRLAFWARIQRDARPDWPCAVGNGSVTSEASRRIRMTGHNDNDYRW
jgi:hypothetical protein